LDTPATGEARARRSRRLRAPLLLALWVLLGFEAAGGLVIFAARLVAGRTPGETLHIVAGVALTALYAIYQWRHWVRVRPFRPQLHYALGLIAAVFMALTNLTGLWLAAFWWHDRIATPGGAAVRYPAALAGVHNVASMVVLSFVGAHLGAVLFRDRSLDR
jgi:hypothetical protein